MRLWDAFSIISRCAADRYLALGRLLLDCSSRKVFDVLSRFPSVSSSYDRLYIILEEWQNNMGENATVKELLNCCRHPDVNIAALVEQEIRRIYRPASPKSVS